MTRRCVDCRNLGGSAGICNCALSDTCVFRRNLHFLDFWIVLNSRAVCGNSVEIGIRLKGRRDGSFLKSDFEGRFVSWASSQWVVSVAALLQGSGASLVLQSDVRLGALSDCKRGNHRFDLIVDFRKIEPPISYFLLTSCCSTWLNK